MKPLSRFQYAIKLATAKVVVEKNLQNIEQINDHDCFNWAFLVFNMIPGSMIGGQRINGEGQSYVVYRGKCYDAETPKGVRNWRNLKSFKRLFAQRGR